MSLYGILLLFCSSSVLTKVFYDLYLADHLSCFQKIGFIVFYTELLMSILFVTMWYDLVLIRSCLRHNWYVWEEKYVCHTFHVHRSIWIKAKLSGVDIRLKRNFTDNFKFNAFGFVRACYSFTKEQGTRLSIDHTIIPIID